MTHTSQGGCHCGNLEITYTTAIEPEDTPLRACQCSFCRKHNVRAASDPAGHIAITAHNPEALRHYRFGAKTIDFLLCGDCGVYVAAYMDDGDKGYANVIVNVLDDRERYAKIPAPADYDDQDASAKADRRRRVWTPATLTLDADHQDGL